MGVTLKLWIVIAAVGALNFASRLSFIAFFANRAMPALLARALKYVPAAMITALIVPMVVAGVPESAALPVNPRIPAAVVAAVVAWFTRSMLYTLAVGMAALWTLQALAG